MGFHMQPAIYVNHLHLKIENLNRSLEFYQQVLGFEVVEKHRSWASLSAGGNTPLLTLEQLTDPTPLNPRSTGLFHVAFLLPERADLANVLTHLIQIGYPLQGASDHLVSEALYLADPDGNGIEIYTDRNADEWIWKSGEVEMATRPLNAEDLLQEVDPNGWQGMPAETIIGHIHLQVNELEKVEEFYTTGFGLDIVSKFGNQALFISSGGYHHHIGMNTWNSAGGKAPDETSIGMKSYSLDMPNDKQAETVKRLTELGYVVENTGEGYRTQDPSGNMVYF